MLKVLSKKPSMWLKFAILDGFFWPKNKELPLFNGLLPPFGVLTVWKIEIKIN